MRWVPSSDEQPSLLSISRQTGIPAKGLYIQQWAGQTLCRSHFVRNLLKLKLSGT